MTFKHMKFEDSAVMRSLEKISVEKGLVKEASTKTKSINELVGNKIFASKNLTENIVKLCDHLRTNGFENYASELEYKFLNYKTAATLYETSKETGEDLIDMAHPKGSHKLEGVPGDSVVETVVDKQKAILNVVNKNPTGKLSTAKDIINAVKVVLADGEKLTAEQRFFYSKKFLDKANNLTDELIVKFPLFTTYFKNLDIKLKSLQNKILSFNDMATHIDELKELENSIYDLSRNYTGNINKDLQDIKTCIFHTYQTIKGNNDSWVKGEFKDYDPKNYDPKPFIEKINNVFSEIKKWQPLIQRLSDDKKIKAQNYSNGLSELLKGLKDAFDKNESPLVGPYIVNLDKKLKDNNYENFSAWLNKETK